MRNRSCLLILSRVPYPPIGGDKLKSNNLVKILHNNYHLHVYIITDEKPVEGAIHFLESNSASFKIFYRPKFRFILNALNGIVSRLPLQVNYYYFKQANKEISIKLANVDFAIANLVRTAPYLKEFDKPKFLDMVDSIALNYIRSRSAVNSFFWKNLYMLEANRLLKFEKELLRKFDSSFFVNYDESNYWSKHGLTEWIPNGVDTKIINYKKKLIDDQPPSIAFLGKMNYQPNIDAVIWFVTNVMPLVNKKIRFIVVGSNPVKKIENLIGKFPNVEIKGFVEDPYQILTSSLAVVAPMQTGGGIQNKILEAMGLGCIVVTTKLGASPIRGAENGRELLVEDAPGLIAQIINEIHDNPEKFSQIKRNAKSLIENRYTWSIYENKLITMLNKQYDKHDY